MAQEFRWLSLAAPPNVNPVDTLRVELRTEASGNHVVETVHLFVNDSPLADLARAVELPYATREGNESLAGDYSALTIGEFRNKDGLLADPACTWFEDGDTVLMGCPCGEWGCWPLTVDIDVSEGAVRWSHFRNGHRDWDLSALGPFMFERAAYEAEAAKLG